MNEPNEAAEPSDAVTWKAVDLDRLSELTRLLIQNAPRDLCVGLVGTLGAGKTRFVQSVAHHLGIQSNDVTSPTFSLVQTYRPATAGQSAIDLQHIDIDLNHVDAYRIADSDEWFETGLEELLEEVDSKVNASWCFVEWADRFEALMPSNTLWIRIQIESDDDRLRQIRVVAGDDRHAPILDSLRQHV